MLIDHTGALQLWDTGGRGAAGLLGPRFFCSAACAVLVCNLQQHHCVSSLSFWQAVVAGEVGVQCSQQPI